MDALSLLDHAYLFGCLRLCQNVWWRNEDRCSGKEEKVSIEVQRMSQRNRTLENVVAFETNGRKTGSARQLGRRLFNRPLHQVHTIRRGCVTLQPVREYTAPALFALMRQGAASGKRPFFISEVIRRRTWRNARCFRFSMNEPRECRCSATKATNRCTAENGKFSFKYLKCLALERETSGCISICFAR